MQHPPQRSWRPFALGLGSFLLVVLAFLAVGHFAHAAITIENVGGSLGLGNADLKQTIVNVLKWALGLLGLVAVMVMLYGGFVWLTSRGDEKKIEKAKRILLNGVIGLVIILVSWAIVLFIQRFITNATNSAAASGQCQMSLPAEWGYCNLCDDAADPRPDYGLLYPDPTCIIPESRDYYATWEDPTHEATNIKLCQAVSAGFGGLIQTAPNPPFENDIRADSDFSVYLCRDSGSGPNCADPVRVSGTPVFTNNVASLDSPDDFAPNSKYYVDVNQVRSVATGNPAAVRPIPPDGWTFLTGTENDEDPPGVLQICSQLRCSNDTTTRCTTDADCGAGNFCQPLRCQTNAQCGGTETCDAMTAPANGETIQCLSPIIEVQFTEGMYPPSAMNPANMAITRTDGQPTTVGIARIDMPTRDIIQVTLNQPLVKNVTYRVTLSAENGADDTRGYRDTCSNALDCGNGLGQCTQSGMPTQGTPADDYRFDFTTADTDTVDCTPIVTGITSPSLHGNSTNQNRVTITGTNFGLAAGKQVRFSGNILATETSGAPSQCFNNNNIAEQATSPACIRTSGSNAIQTIVPTGSNQFSPTGAIDGGVVVIKGTQESPLSTATTDIQSPHINGIFPREGKAGRFVTILGDNFGGSGRVRFRSDDGTTNYWADVPSCVTNAWTNSQIIVQVPEGFAENTRTHIQVCGKGDAGCADVANISNTSRFDYKNIDGPNLCGMRAVGSAVPYVSVFGSNVPDDPMEVLGDGFGTNLGVVGTRYSAIDGSAEAPFDEKHLVARPSGALPNGTYNFFVTVDGRASNPLTYSIPKDPPPQVVQDASCNVGNTPPIMPSPNVYPESTGVCRNISLEVRFTQVMDPLTLTPAANVTVQRCNNTDPFLDSACTAPINGARIPRPAVNPTSVRFTPVAVLDDGYWYKATITSGVQSATGAAIPTPYTWKFRVRASGGDCALDAVVVNPWQIGPLYTGQQGPFEAVPANAKCALLTNIPGAFTWAVTVNPALVALGVPTTNPVTANPTDNNIVATVQAGAANGTATIQASHSGKSGSGNLIVQRNYCETNNDCATQMNSYGATCTGAICNVAQRTCEPLVLDLQSGSQTGTAVNGPAGNLINVRGCYFGGGIGAIGKVTFTNSGAPVNGSFALCGPAGWTNDSIRVQTMPDTDPPASQSTIWGVQVFADNGAPGLCSNDANRTCRADADCTAGGVCDSTLQSNSNATYTISLQCSKPDGGFTGIPGSGMPILCNTNQPSGREGDAITYSGDKFVGGAGNTQAYFTQATDTATQLQNVGAAPTTIAAPKNLTSHVPGLTAIPQLPATYARTTVGVLESPGNYCIATPVRFDVSCNQNNECSTGCCQTNICHPTADCTNGFVAGVTNPAGTCRNSQFSISIAPGKTIVPGTVNASTIKLFVDGTTEVATTLQLVGQTITVRPALRLGDGVYTVRLLGGAAGIQATDGTFLPPLGFTSTSYTVDTSFRICTIASVVIRSAVGMRPVMTSDLFTCAGDACTDDVHGAVGNQHAYIVEARDASGAGPLAIETYTWTQGDAGGSYGATNVYAPVTPGAPCPTNETSEGYCATGQNVANGSEQLTAAVVGPVYNGEPSGSGSAAIPIRTFMCTKPWPAAPNPWPFRDPARTMAPLIPSHDFTFAFCTDDVQGSTLENPVQSPVVSGEVRKEYFMLVDDKNGVRTGDSIGVRIIGDPTSPYGTYTTDRSPRRWYERTFGEPPTGSSLEVDGYPALREGRTVYVTADYHNPVTNLSRPAVYVFSHTDNARSETVQIFEQIIKNLRFNDAQTPELRADMRNDVKWFQAMNEVVYAIAAYYRNAGKNPTLDAGTYLKHMTMTAWPSWQREFSQVLGVTLPEEPKKLWDPKANPRQLPAFCVEADGYNQDTCWDEGDKLMQFPSNGTNPPESTALAYVYDPAAGVASLYGTGSARVSAHAVVNWNVIPPNRDICPGVSTCTGFNIEMTSDKFGTIDNGRIKPPADSTDPTVVIELPIAGNIAGAVTFVVTATDQPGGSGVSTVAFSIVGKASGTVSVPDEDGKYRWTWNSRSVLNGAYTLSVTATDRAGNASAPLNRAYTVTNPPGDSEPPLLTAPTPPDQDSGAPGIQWNGTNVALTASATDIHPAPSPAANNTGVAKVEFYLGISKLGESVCTVSCSTAPFTANLTVPAATLAGFPNGTYTYTVVAYDGFGNTSARAHTVMVAKGSGESPAVPPVVSIALPSGAPPVIVSGANTDVVATATDASGIDRVEFYVDADITPRSIDFNGPYSFSWILAGPTYTNGSPHTVRAVAYDRFGNSDFATQAVTYGAVAGPDTQRPVISDAYAPTPVPMEGAQLRNTVILSATLTDNQAVRSGELRIDGLRVPGIVCAYTNPPSLQTCTIAYAWNTLPEDVGQHTVSITAYDTAGFVTTATYTLSVTNQVLMSISTPRSGTTVQDSTATGTCQRTTSRTCRTSRDCPLTELGHCESDPGRKCTGDSACTFEPGDFCVGAREACIAGGGSTGVPIAVTVTDTCRADLSLSAVDIFLDGVLLTSIPNCNGTCTYNWNSKSTTSNGAHVLTAIGRDDQGCRGGDRSNITVNNIVNDTVPPVIDSVNFNNVPWPSTGDVYVTGPGTISVYAHDPPGGSGMRFVTIAIQNSSGTQLALQTCSTPDVLTPNPCELVWTPADDAGYRVVVNAQDVSGNDATTRTHVVNVDSLPPQMTWASPVDGSTVNSPPDVTLTATSALDPTAPSGYASGIRSVVFSQNAADFFPPATGAGGTYTGTYPLAVGPNQQFTATITDMAGNTYTTPIILLTVNGADVRAPWIIINNPLYSNYYISGTYPFSALAGDWGGSGIRDVQFYLDGTCSSTGVCTGGSNIGSADATAPYIANFDTTTLVQGSSHTMNAVACDKATPTNLCRLALPMTFLVNNAGGDNCGNLICSGATPQCCGGPPWQCQDMSQACALPPGF